MSRDMIGLMMFAAGTVFLLAAVWLARVEAYARHGVHERSRQRCRHYHRLNAEERRRVREQARGARVA